MNEALLVMLALLWAVVLLPGAVRSRRANAQATVGGFERAMDVLRRQPDGRYLMVPGDAGRIVTSDDRDAPPRSHREDPTIARRRTWFSRLVVTTGVLLATGLLLGGAAWTLFVLSLGITGGYAALLRRYKLRRDEVRSVVRELRGDEVPAADRERLPVAVGGGSVPVASRPDEPWQPMTGVRIRRWED